MQNERMYHYIWIYPWRIHGAAIYANMDPINFWKTPLTPRLFLAELYWMSDKDQHLGIWPSLPKMLRRRPRRGDFHGEHDDQQQKFGGFPQFSVLISPWSKSPWTNFLDQFKEIFRLGTLPLKRMKHVLGQGLPTIWRIYYIMYI